MTRHLPRLALVATLLLAPFAAQAAPAFVTTRLDLRAGPGAEYPAVAFLEPGLQVEVLGCLEGYGWCDVVIGQDRGWVAGAYLQAPYQEHRAPLVRVAPAIGLPIVGFSVGSYWERNYRDRPWYAERGRWDGPHRGFGGPPPGRGPDWGRDRGWEHRGAERGPGWDRADHRDRDWGRQERGDDGPRHWQERDGRGPDGPGRDGPRGGPDRGGFDRGGPDRGDRGPR